MTTTTPQRPRFHGRLTDDEMAQLQACLGQDPVAGFVQLWDLLRAKAGEPPAGEGAVISPDEYSLPYNQSQALLSAIEPDNPELHFAWVLAWINYGPAWHADA